MAKKYRGRNEGSVFQLSNKRWRAQIYHRGQRISKNVETKAEALEWIRSMQTDLDRGYDFKGSTVTLNEYLPKWLENHRVSLRAKTAHQYGAIIKNHILPNIGEKKLKDLRLLQIEQYYSSLLQKGLGPRTVKTVHNILHASLDKAVRYGLLIFNPTHGASLPKHHHDEMKVLEAYQVSQFLVAAQNSPNYAFFHLAITTGMRMGELFGLKWADIQWSGGALHVQRQKQYVPGQGCCFIEPKTNAGRRTIKLGEGSLDVLRHHKVFQEFQKERAGGRWKDLDLVFCSSVGTPGDASNIRIDFNRVLQMAGLPKMRFHDLRHTAASLLLNNKVPVIIVSNMLGHSKPSVTLDIYAHTFNDMQGEAAIVMDKLVTPILVEIPQMKTKALK
jgi:integrase